VGRSIQYSAAGATPANQHSVPIGEMYIGFALCVSTETGYPHSVCFLEFFPGQASSPPISCRRNSQDQESLRSNVSEVMTTTWIKERAEAIRRAEKEKKMERDRQVEAASVLKAKTEPYWRELIGVLEESVKEFNQEFPETERRIDPYEKSSATTLTIRRTAYPSAVVKVSLNIAGTSIQYSINSTQRKGANTNEQQANLIIGIVDDQVGYVEGGVSTHDDVAKRLLEPFFDF
jgi:hypothetical protein